MNNTTPAPQKQECPYFPELLETQKLRRKLEQEHKLRKEAEAQNIWGFIVGCLASFVFTLVVMQVLISVGMNAETAEACARIACACAILFLTFSFVLLTINFILGCHVKHKQEKKDTDDKKAA